MIQSILFLVLFLIIPVFWAGLLRLSGIRLLTISIPGILMLEMLIYQYIGYPTLFFYLDDYRAVFIQDRAIVWQMFLWSVYSISMILLGFVVARRVMGPLHLPKQYNSFHHYFVSSRPTEELIVFTLFGLSLAVLFLYISKVGVNNLAILAAVGWLDIDTSSKALRSAMGNAFEGKYHWYRLFMRDFLSIASLAFFAHWLMRRRRISALIFIASFLMAGFSMLMATEKGPFLQYLVSLLMIYVIIKKDGRLPLKLIFLLTPFGLLVMGWMYVYFMNSPSIWEGIHNGFSRIITGQMNGLYHYLEIFPKAANYLHGLSFPNPGGIFPWQPYSLTVEVMNIVKPELEAKNIVGSMPTFFWGEMYANFGYLGILIPPFFVGYLIYALNIFIFRLFMSPLVLALFVWALLHFSNLANTGLSGYVLDTTLLIMAIFLFLALGIQGRGAIRYRNKRPSQLSPHRLLNEAK